jgi:hypothetical protein
MTNTTMNASVCIESIAKLSSLAGWVFGIVALIVLRPLLLRIRKGKIAGQELEVEPPAPMSSKKPEPQPEAIAQTNVAVTAAVQIETKADGKHGEVKK